MSAPRRVRVTSPQTRIALARKHRPAQHLLPLPLPGSDDEADLTAARAVFARQRRLALRTMGLLGLLVFGLSGLLSVLPVLGRITLLGIPYSWLLLMAASYPLLLVIALWHVWRAECVEGPERGADTRP